MFAIQNWPSTLTWCILNAMNYGFWEKLPKPFFCLAPMYDVTDCAFREMVALASGPRLESLATCHSESAFSADEESMNYQNWVKRMRCCASPSGELSMTESLKNRLDYGFVPVMFTEFVSVDGLFNEKSREKLVKLHFGFTENQWPIVAQIWGTDPEKFRYAAQLIKQLGFDGIDINMGCPDRAVTRAGAGGALIKNPSLAKEIILAAQEGAKDVSFDSASAFVKASAERQDKSLDKPRDLPVSVKTRIGYEKNVLDKWLPELLSVHPAALTIHARTVKNMSRVPADWEVIKWAGGIAKNTGVKIIGNGDVRSLEEARERVKETGCDGVMVGRGALGNYWFFTDGFSPSITERLRAVTRHAELFEEYYCPVSSGGGEASARNLRRFVHIRKHLGAFAKGFPGAQDLRVKLLAAGNAGEVKEIIENWLKENPENSSRL